MYLFMLYIHIEYLGTPMSFANGPEVGHRGSENPQFSSHHVLFIYLHTWPLTWPTQYSNKLIVSGLVLSTCVNLPLPINP